MIRKFIWISRLVIPGLLCLSDSTAALAWSFDPDMLDDDKKNADVSLFNRGGQPPGVYLVDILLNGKLVDSREVSFLLKADGSILQPCLSVQLLSGYGLKTENYPAIVGPDGCADLSVIPQATTEFQFAAQQLLLTIPQASLRPRLSGIAPQQLWDDGVPAFLMGYRAGASKAEFSDREVMSSETSWGQINPGINLGAWRLRNQTNWQSQRQGGQKWQTAYTRAERGLYDIKSRLTVGDSISPGDVMESVPFRGLMLGSDEQMVPYTQRAFAPIVRGIARTQALIEVKQNGFIIYNTEVPPGPFALTDFFPAGEGGRDLQVTIREADGSLQVFSVPWQMPAIALREGYMKYNIMAGEYRPATSTSDHQPISQLSMMYGLPGNLTLYGGMQGAEHYQGTTFGLGVSMNDWGAVSLDATGARGQRHGQQAESGAAWRVRYSKTLISTDTTLTAASTQYASPGYNTLPDVLDSWARHGNSTTWWSGGKRDRFRSESSLTLNQTFSQWGWVSLYGSRRDWQSHAGHEDSFSFTYGAMVKNTSVSLSFSQNRHTNPVGRSSMDKSISLWFSMPLNVMSNNTVSASGQMISSSKGTSSYRAGLNGQAFDHRLQWDVKQDYLTARQEDDRYSSSIGLGWRGGYGQVHGSYLQRKDQRQMTAEVAGGVVAHQHGITAAQPLGDTIALVEAPGASNTSVIGWPGTRTDFRGYTLQTNITPYQENNIGIDPNTLPLNAEVLQTDIRVIPTRGAVVSAKFVIRTGGRALMTLTRPGGDTVPFGALAVLEDEGVGAGVTGEDGLIYLTGLPDKGKLRVKWSGQQCQVNFTLPARAGETGLYEMEEVCL